AGPGSRPAPARSALPRSRPPARPRRAEAPPAPGSGAGRVPPPPRSPRPRRSQATDAAATGSAAPAPWLSSPAAATTPATPAAASAPAPARDTVVVDDASPADVDRPRHAVHARWLVTGS